MPDEIARVKKKIKAPTSEECRGDHGESQTMAGQPTHHLTESEGTTGPRLCQLVDKGIFMNAVLQIPADFFIRGKTKRLMKKLGAEGVTSLIRLWAYAALLHQDGKLSGMCAEEIEAAVDWDGEDYALATVLREVGFLDGEDGAYSLCDWEGREEAKRECKTKKPKPDRETGCPYEKIVSLYHLELPGNPKCIKLSDKRKKLSNARWKNVGERLTELGEEDTVENRLDYFRRFFVKASMSDFLTGRKTTSRGTYKADFDKLMSLDGWLGVIEGRYDNRRGETS